MSPRQGMGAYGQGDQGCPRVRDGAGGAMVWLWGVCWVPRDRGPGVSWDEEWVPRAIDWGAWGSLGPEGQVPKAED